MFFHTRPRILIGIVLLKNSQLRYFFFTLCASFSVNSIGLIALFIVNILINIAVHYKFILKSLVLNFNSTKKHFHSYAQLGLNCNSPKWIVHFGRFLLALFKTFEWHMSGSLLFWKGNRNILLCFAKMKKPVFKVFFCFF